MKTMSKWVLVGLILLGGRAWAQPAAREFYQKSMSATFNAQVLVANLGRRAADRIIEYLEGEGAGTAMAYTAIQQLPFTGHPKAVPVLKKFLSEDSPVGPQWQMAVRSTAIDGLAQLDTPEARRALAEALGGPSNKVYASNIVKHCGRLRAKECAGAIVDYVKREKTYYDDQLLNLAQCSPQTAVELIMEQLKGRRGGRLYDWEVMALGVAGDEGIPLLIEKARAMKSRRWSGEWGANLAWALGKTRSRDAVPLLREIVKGDNPMLVYLAAVSLAQHKDKNALQWIRAAQGLKFKRDAYYASDGSDSDWGFFRRERVRQGEFDLGLAYAMAALGESGAKRRLKKASDGKTPALALLADTFLLKLGDRAAAKRIIKRINQAARKGFSGLSSDMYWNDSLGEALQALNKHAPEAGLQAALVVSSSTSHWMYKDLGGRMLKRLPRQKYVRTLVAALGKGSYKYRAEMRDQLRFAGDAMLPELLRSTPRFDLDGRTLAVALLGEFDDAAGKKLLQKISRTDPAWQVRRLARAALALRRGRAWPPRVKMPGGAQDYVAYSEAEKMPKDPVGAAELKGKVYVAGQDGLVEYDGYQWHPLRASGLCDDPVTAITSFKQRLYVFSKRGLAVGDGKRFTCKSWNDPTVHLAVADKKGLMLGTAKGLYYFDGKRAMEARGSPKRRVTAIARQGKFVWVAYQLPALTPGVRQQPSLAKTLAPKKMKPALYKVGAGRFQPVVEPLLSYEGWRLPMEVNALAASGNTLLVGCSEGLLSFDGKKWELIGDQQGYDTRLQVDAVHVSPDGTVTALQGPWLDQRDKRGRWRRSRLGKEGIVESALMMAKRRSSTLLRSNQDAWLVLGEFEQYGHKMMPGVVVRLAGPRSPGRRLPPETLFVMAKAGEWRWENPDTVVRPPNRARISGRPKPVEVPAAQASIEAAAQDPWDYESVMFQFKLDESPWGKWQKGNGILTPLMGEGEHLLRVRAKDASGNVDPTPAVLHFTVHTREVAVVRILDGKFKSVFPSQHRRYERENVGTVELENRSTSPVDVKINLKMRDMFDTPSSRKITIPSGGKQKIALTAPFSDRVLELKGGGDVQAVVEVEFEHEGIQRQVRRTFPIKIHAANAFDWSEPSRLAGFINSADPLVEKLGAAVYRTFSRSKSSKVLSMRNLALAAYLFRTLDAMGVRYKPDPDSPFSAVKPGSAAVIDTVRYPGQTLVQKVGDCDDLTVLYASLLEQVGIRSAVVPVEGHVFLMFDTGVMEVNRAAFQIPDELLVKRGGTMWAPVEVTYLGREDATFDAAWSAGAEAFKTKYRPKPGDIVEVREAWTSTPPATLRVRKMPSFKQHIKAGEDEVSGLLEGYRQTVVGKAPSGKSAGDLLDRGRLLAKNGFFDEAEKALKQAAKKKFNFDVAYALGVVYAGKRKTKQAATSFEKASRLAGNNQERFRASIALATTYRAAGNLKKAKKACNKALKYNPAARFDSKYSPLIRFLRSSQKTKAAGEEGPVPYFQLMAAGM